MAVSLNGGLDDKVERSPWEPRHEWESRLKFVEDHVDAYGLEKSVNLSKVWSNMKFLGCSYPSKTEMLVAHYPLPDPETLRASRKRRRPDGDLDDAADFGGKLSHSVIASQVDALIAAVRQGHDIVPNLTQPTTQSATTVHPLLKSVAENVCLCEDCLGKSQPWFSALQTLNQIFDHYKTKFDPSFEYEYVTDFAQSAQPPSGSEGNKCVLTINRTAITEEVSARKKEAKSMVASRVLEKMEHYQQGCSSKPRCERGGQKRLRSDQPEGGGEGIGTTVGISSQFFSSAVQKASRGRM